MFIQQQRSSLRVHVGDMAAGELQALTRRRDTDRERDVLRHDLMQTEQRLGLLRQRLELLETGSDPPQPDEQKTPGSAPD